MNKKMRGITVACLLSIVLVFEFFSVSSFALPENNRTYKKINAIATRDWTYACDPTATFHYGAPTFADEAVLFGTQWSICWVTITKSTIDSNALFSGGITPDGDFNLNIAGPVGAQYKITVDTHEQDTGNHESIQFVFTADAENASIQKVGTQYAFINMTMVSINDNYENMATAAQSYASFTPGMNRYYPEIYDINKAKIVCCYLPGTKIN